MATAVAAPPTTKLLQDADLKARLQQFRQPDNLTNWYYLLRSYLLLALAIGGAVYFFAHRAEWGLHWAWDVPVAVVAVVLVGAGQHQLTVLAHEASHHTLFKNKLLNELVSDWCCMFPVLSRRTTTACTTWPTTSSSTTRSGTRTCRRCGSTATGPTSP